MTRIQPTRTITASNGAGLQTSTISILCRICYDGERDEELITPCNCRGTVAFVHRSCLETWLGESNTTTCELCHHVFRTERVPKFTSVRGIWHWCRYSPGGCSRGVKSDVLACSIITPLSIVITYICLFSSEYYSQKKFAYVPAAKWTSLSLLIMIIIMLIGYYMWTYSIIRMHARFWYSWWQRTCDVRYIQPSDADIPIDVEVGLNTLSTSNFSRSIAIGTELIRSCSLTVVEEPSKSQPENENILVKKEESLILSKTTQTDDLYGGSEYILETQELESK